MGHDRAWVTGSGPFPWCLWERFPGGQGAHGNIQIRPQWLRRMARHFRWQWAERDAKREDKRSCLTSLPRTFVWTPTLLVTLPLREQLHTVTLQAVGTSESICGALHTHTGTSSTQLGSHTCPNSPGPVQARGNGSLGRLCSPWGYLGRLTKESYLGEHLGVWVTRGFRRNEVFAGQSYSS